MFNQKMQALQTAMNSEYRKTKDPAVLRKYRAKMQQVLSQHGIKASIGFVTSY